jgi:hypothetical protein
VAHLNKCEGFYRKIRVSQSVFLCQRSYNAHGAYLAIEEFSGGGRQGVILLPEGRKKWGWCGFGEVLRSLPKPFITMKQVPPAVAPPSSDQRGVFVGRSFVQAALISNTPANSDVIGGAPGLCASSSSVPSLMKDMQHARTNPGTVAKMVREDVAKVQHVRTKHCTTAETYVEDVAVLPNYHFGSRRVGAGGFDRKGTKGGDNGGGSIAGKPIGTGFDPSVNYHS